MDTFEGEVHQVFAYFSGELPEELQAHFYRESKHPIYEVELLPTLVALIVCKAVFQSCQVVFYIDNEAANTGLIRGAGATPFG